MTKKWRIRLTTILVILGVPLVLASLAVYYTTTGKIGHLIALEYAKVMPGRLSIGAVQFLAADQVHLTDITLSEGFSEPLARIAEVDAKIDVFNGRLTALRLRGVRVHMNADTFDLLTRIIDAGDKLKPSHPPQSWDLEADGEVQFASGLRLEKAFAKGRITGALFEIDGGTVIGTGGKMAKVHIAGRVQGPATPGIPQNKRIIVELQEAEGPLPEALDAVTAIGLLPRTPDGLRRWLPARLDASGSTVIRDLGVLHYSAPVKTRWLDATGRAGSLEGQLDADANRIAVAISSGIDPALGRVSGANLVINLRTNTVTLDAPRFAPGPGLNLPPRLPIDALIKQTPRLKVTYGITAGTTRIQLDNAEQNASAISAEWGDQTPLRITGANLPLTLAQPIMPEGLTIGGGQATKLSLAVATDEGLGATRLRDLQLTVEQGRLAYSGWSIGPVTGQLSATPQDDGNVRLTMSLPLGATEQIGTATIAGTAASGGGTLRLQAIDALLARLHGPTRLPTITGALEVDLRYTRSADGTLVLDINRALFDRNDVSFERRDLLAGVRTQLKGVLRWQPDARGGVLKATVGGQLVSGRLRLPGDWLNLAVHTPIFTLVAEARPTTANTPAHVILRELLVRAADPAGSPLTDGYSAQFDGTIDEHGEGTVNGLVDHANLAWVNQQIGLPTGAVIGDGAVTCTASISMGQIEKLTGHFLPLNADVSLGHSFRANGITGGVDFSVQRDVKPPTKTTP